MGICRSLPKAQYSSGRPEKGSSSEPRGGCAGSLKGGIQRKRKKRTRAAVKKGSRGLRSRFVLVFSSRAVCRDLRLFGDRRAGCLILVCSIHPLFLMYSAVDASSRASGAPKTTNKTPRLPSAVSGGNKAPWRLGTPYGAKSAPPREWYPTSVPCWSTGVSFFLVAALCLVFASLDAR